VANGLLRAVRVSRRLAKPAPPSHESDSAVQLPLRGQRYSVMPVNDPTIDIARIDRRTACRAEPGRVEPSQTGPSQAGPEPRRAIPN